MQPSWNGKFRGCVVRCWYVKWKGKSYASYHWHKDISNFLLTGEKCVYLVLCLCDKHELTLWLDLPSIFPLHHWKFYCLPFASEIRFYSSGNKRWILLSFGLPECTLPSVWSVEYKSFRNKKQGIRSLNKTTNSFHFKQFKDIAWECVRNLIWFPFCLRHRLTFGTLLLLDFEVLLFSCCILLAVCGLAHTLLYCYIVYMYIFYVIRIKRDIAYINFLK